MKVVLLGSIRYEHNRSWVRRYYRYLRWNGSTRPEARLQSIDLVRTIQNANG